MIHRGHHQLKVIIHVVLEAVDLGVNDVLESFVLERVDVQKQSSEMGIDIYIEALELVLVKLQELRHSQSG